MKKYVLTAGLAIFLACLFASNAFAAGDGSWERVKKAGVLKIGIDDAFPPMEFRNDKNELVGFDIDASRELGKRLGIKVEHMPTVWDTVILSLKSKKFDVVWSGMSITPEREKEIAFTKPYIMEKQVIVVKAGNKKIKGLKDLGAETVVGVQLGSTSEEALAKLNKKFKEIKKYDKNTDAFLDLKIGRIDALAVDELVGRYYLSQKPGRVHGPVRIAPLRAHRNRPQEGRCFTEKQDPEDARRHVQRRHHEEDFHQVVWG